MIANLLKSGLAKQESASIFEVTACLCREDIKNEQTKTLERTHCRENFVFVTGTRHPNRPLPIF